jgi:hypothetical protein
MMRIETHQLEGLDDRRRVFNRHVEIRRTEEGYTANFYYEGRFFSSDSHPTIKEAMGRLIQRLQQSGFSRLRSRLNFRGQRYLAEREPWVDYGDAS